jgi:hypothetical protein
MSYVYLVQEDIHGLMGIYADKDKATEEVKRIGHGMYDLPDNEPFDYDDEDQLGWIGAVYWERVAVIK